MLAEALGLSVERARRLLEGRASRVLRYHGLTYIVLRRDVGEHYEGTSVVLTRSGAVRVIEGYPHIRRILLLGRAVPRHFIDEVVVEEKMDGHNVRVARIEGEVYAFTRGGYICPYTTARMRRKYGRALERAFEALGEEAVIAGEVVGLENPYTRYYYPEAPEWDYFVFDIFTRGLEPLPVAERRRLAEEAGLRNVPQLGVFLKDDWREILEATRGLEELGREGVVLKDPEYRVEPLKYTTSYTNVHDIELGMRYPFDEGRTFIFPRVLRQIFKAIEEGWDEDRLRAEAERLGAALLEPAIEAVRTLARGEPLAEEFTLTFASMEELEEFTAYSAGMGVPLSVVSIEAGEGYVRARFLKHKKSEEELRKILRTGISPLD
ncbi:MAG: RNA ligase [Desulfurococcales archaeon]|nr:RNA ligase [Desulfurococcales archaeon]